MMIRLLYMVLVVLMVACSDGAGKDVKNGVARCRVAFLFPYSDHDASSVKLIEEVGRQMKASGVAIDSRSYYLESERVMNSDSMAWSVLDSLKGYRPHVLVTVGDQALLAILGSQHPQAKHLPVVFCAVRFVPSNLIEGHSNVCGYRDVPDYLRNMGFIFSMLGKVPVEMGNDTTNYAASARRMLEQQLVNTDVKMSFEGNDEMVDYSKSLDSLAIYSYPFCQMSGQQLYCHFLNSHKSSREVFFADRFDISTVGLCSYSNMPVFTAVHEMFDYNDNVIGGYFTTVDQMAREVAECAIGVVAGVVPSSLGQLNSRKQFVVDYRRFVDAGYNPSVIPENAVVLNRPRIDLEDRGVQMIVALVVVLLISIVMGINLLVNKSRNRRYVSAITAEHENMISAVFPNSSCFLLKGESISFDRNFSRVLHRYSKSLVPTLEDLRALVYSDDMSVVERMKQKDDEKTETMRFRLVPNEGDEPQWFQVDMKGVVKGGYFCKVGVLTRIGMQKERERKIDRMMEREKEEIGIRDGLVEKSMRACELLDMLYGATLSFCRETSDDNIEQQSAQVKELSDEMEQIMEEMSQK